MFSQFFPSGANYPRFIFSPPPQHVSCVYLDTVGARLLLLLHCFRTVLHPPPHKRTALLAASFSTRRLENLALWAPLDPHPLRQQVRSVASDGLLSLAALLHPQAQAEMLQGWFLFDWSRVSGHIVWRFLLVGFAHVFAIGRQELKLN